MASMSNASAIRVQAGTLSCVMYASIRSGNHDHGKSSACVALGRNVAWNAESRSGNSSGEQCVIVGLEDDHNTTFKGAESERRADVVHPASPVVGPGKKYSLS